MDYFFHADTTKYRRRLRGTAIIVLVPLFGSPSILPILKK